MTAPVMKRKPIIIVQGGQYGSEAKGLITSKLTRDRRVDIAIRTGTVNAGHTVYHDGKPYAMQQLPVSWANNPDCDLVLGPGAYIHNDILSRELIWIAEATGRTVAEVDKLVHIDHNCGIHTEEHTRRSGVSGRHHTMGATGKGSSEAVVDKIMGRGDRHTDLACLRTARTAQEFGYTTEDTVALVNNAYDQGKQLMIEGTQGTLLDLHLGPYPYTTHKQTQAASWLAEAGLSATLPVDLVLVMRTYPIRVAGNSGPLPNEVTWASMADAINQTLAASHLPRLIDPRAIVEWEMAVRAQVRGLGDPVGWSEGDRLRHPEVVSEYNKRAWASLTPGTQAELKRLFEMTTVTKKLRRIAQWDWDDAKRSVMLNRPTSLALTFMNYEFPQAWGVTRPTFGDLDQSTRSQIIRYVREREDKLGVRVGYIGFGPSEASTFSLYEDEEHGQYPLISDQQEQEAGK